MTLSPQIKKLVKGKFPKATVSVTCRHGWYDVKINLNDTSRIEFVRNATPEVEYKLRMQRECDSDMARECQKLILEKYGRDMGFYYTDGPECDRRVQMFIDII